MVAAVLGEKVVYPLCGDSAIPSGSPLGHPTGEPLVANPQKGQLKLMWEESAQLQEFMAQ